jgi:hypothetical protein
MDKVIRKLREAGDSGNSSDHTSPPYHDVSEAKAVTMGGFTFKLKAKGKSKPKSKRIQSS